MGIFSASLSILCYEDSWESYNPERIDRFQTAKTVEDLTVDDRVALMMGDAALTLGFGAQAFLLSAGGVAYKRRRMLQRESQKDNYEGLEE